MDYLTSIRKFHEAAHKRGLDDLTQFMIVSHLDYLTVRRKINTLDKFSKEWGTGMDLKGDLKNLRKDVVALYKRATSVTRYSPWESDVEILNKVRGYLTTRTEKGLPC